MKIIADNAADRATITASSTSAGLSVLSMLTDIKSDVHRATGTSVTYVLTWPVAEMIGGLHLLTNCSPTGMIRVRGYSDVAGTALLFDTTMVYGCNAPAISLRGWTAIKAASAYAYGGGAHLWSWFNRTSVKNLTVDVSDPNNQQGLVECWRVVAGDVWTSAYNHDFGSPLTHGSLSKQYRTDASDLRTEPGGRFRKQSLNLGTMPEVDRVGVLDLLRGNGLDTPFLISPYPNSPNIALQRDYQMWCKLVGPASIRAISSGLYGTTLDMETV